MTGYIYVIDGGAFCLCVRFESAWIQEFIIALKMSHIGGIGPWTKSVLSEIFSYLCYFQHVI